MKKVVKVAAIIIVVFMATTWLLGGDDKSEADETKTAEVTEEIEEDEEETEHRTGEEIVGVSDKDIADADITGFSSVRNDATGKWKYTTIADSDFDVTEYAVSIYKEYGGEDAVLAVINFSTNTTACINKVAGYLDVTIHEYVKGEEHDAKEMFSGMVLGEYMVYTDNGDVEKIQ